MNETRMGRYAVGALALVATAVFVMRLMTGDIDRARHIFQGLVEGKRSVEWQIDWPRLTALDTKVGDEYSKLPTDVEKRNYARAFILKFAYGFRQGGGDLKAFTNWRTEPASDSLTVVAADYAAKQKTLLFQLSPEKKLVSMQWK